MVTLGFNVGVFKYKRRLHPRRYDFIVNLASVKWLLLYRLIVGAFLLSSGRFAMVFHQLLSKLTFSAF